jgi:hypothetical protein
MIVRKAAISARTCKSIGWSEQDHGGQSDSDLVWPEK